MPQNRRRGLKPFAGDPNDPEGLGVWVRRHLEHQRARGYSEKTLRTTEQRMSGFIEWAVARGIERPSEVTRPMLEAYQRALFYYRKTNGQPLAWGTQRYELTLLRNLFRWLARQNAIPSNPASDLELPRTEQRLPKHVLNEREMEKVLAVADLSDALGLRDRALMEVLYSTGMRRHEVGGLRLNDIDAHRGVVTIRLGKGRKDRTVPIGERALFWVQRYVDEVRSTLVVVPDTGVVFLTENGDPISLSRLTDMLRDYIVAADIGKTGAAHLFRHSMATMLLEAGADIRVIQEILGHALLTTTQIYTRVAVNRLKVVHDACHPGARLDGGRRERATTAEPSSSDPAPTSAALLAVLAAEEEAERAEGDRAGPSVEEPVQEAPRRVQQVARERIHARRLRGEVRREGWRRGG
jgi:integrase/recombinase XerD